MGSGQSFEEKQEKVGEMVKSWKKFDCNTLKLVKKYGLIWVLDAFEDYYKAMKKRTGKNIIIQGTYVCEMIKILGKMVNEPSYEGENLVYYYTVTVDKSEQKYYRERKRRIETLKTNLGVSRAEEHPCDLKF